jgi:arylsulfatase A-like enzyme
MKAFLLLTLISLSLHQATAAQKPNVLFLAVDDMNDWIGCLGKKPRALTPNIDRLAARGVNFSNAHTAGIYCAPSRSAIFTGQYASTTGCYEVANFFYHQPGIRPLQVGFAEAGYRAFGSGKLFHHPAGNIDQRGWTEYFLRSKEQRKTGWPLNSWTMGVPLPAPFPHSVYNKGKQVKEGLFLDWGAVPNEKEEELVDTIWANWTISKLKEKHDTPFFLAMGLFAPHYPNYCPQKYFDLYDPAEIKLPLYKNNDIADLPPTVQKKMRNRGTVHKAMVELDAIADAIHGYLACISYADAMIGRVLDALAASPHADNTIVVLWSDHGYHFGEKGQWGKHTLWERTSNVPFIWAGPGIAQGRTTDVSVSLIDMYPTFVELCGLAMPDHKLEGKSIASTLANPGSAKDRTVYLPYVTPGEYALINRDWRYIHWNDGEELYDLSNDPNEWTNLATDPKYADKIAQIQKLAPTDFATPARKLSISKNLVFDGETFRWKVR